MSDSSTVGSAVLDPAGTSRGALRSCAAVSRGSGPSLETPSNKSAFPFPESDKALWRRFHEKDLKRWLRESLEELGPDYAEDLAKVRQCGRLVVYSCAACSGLSGRQEFHCHNRLCVYCSRHLAGERSRRARALIRRMSRPVHVVLTVKNRSSYLETRDHLWKSWGKLRHRKKFVDTFSGGFGYEESTVGADGSWHVHFHCVFDGAMSHADLEKLWVSCTKDSFKVWIRSCDEDAAVEVAKYAAKLNEALLRSPDHVAEYLDGAKGKRTFFTFGSCYGVDLDADPELLAEGASAEDQADDQARHRCPHCGGDSVLLRRVEAAGVRLPRPWERSECVALPGGWFVRAGP